MQSYALAFAAFTTAAFAGWESKTGSCNTGSVQCCNLNEEKQISTGKNDALISTGDIASQVGVQCDQVPVLAIAIEDECKNTPVCCEDVDEGAAIGISCTPISAI